eukprot:8094705-Prorocentrum_lima.AAC.1
MATAERASAIAAHRQQLRHLGAAIKREKRKAAAAAPITLPAHLTPRELCIMRHVLYVANFEIQSAADWLLQ